MRTFEQWLMNEVLPPNGNPNYQRNAQPAAQQPQQTQQTPQANQQQAQNKGQQQEEGPAITPGMENQFVAQMKAKYQGGDQQLAQEWKAIFDTGRWHLRNGGPNRVSQFMSSIKKGFPNTPAEKYLEEAENRIKQGRVWDGESPNLMWYDPSWSASSFANMGDGETIGSAWGNLVGNMSRIIGGSHQRSVFDGS